MPMTFQQFLKFLTEMSAEKEAHLKKQYGLSDEHMSHIKAADPTPNHEYSKWIAHHVHKGNIRLPEDQSKIHNQLKTFHRLKASPKFTGKKDIGQHTPGSLYDTVQSHSQEQSKKAETAENMGRVIMHKGDYAIHKFDPKELGHEKAVKSLMNASSGTNWCTAHKEYADHYLKQGPSYVMFHKGSRFAQLHPKSKQYMDRADEPLHHTYGGYYKPSEKPAMEHPLAQHFLNLGAEHDPELKDYHSNVEHLKHYSLDSNGQPHSVNDQPSVIHSDGSKEWHKHGQLHRENDLPAIERFDGAKHWYQNGQHHRVHGPATIYGSNSKTWYFLHGEPTGRGDKDDPEPPIGHLRALAALKSKDKE